MAMARVSSGLAYPERFFAAASYTGLDGSPANTLTSKFPNDVALLLHALYHQATIGPCKIPKPRSWSPVEQGKWTSWNRLGNMASTEAMRLFIKILEEEDPGWYSRASSSILEPVQDVETNHVLKDEGVIENGNTLPEIEIISTEFENVIETQDKDVVMEGISSVGVYDQWVASPVSGPRPKTRYKHGAAIIDDKMYVFGGNHNGRYLNDLQALDLRNRTWSKVVAKTGSDALESPSPVTVSPCAGHSLIPWGGNKLLSVAGHAKDPCEFMQVKVFDLQTCSWSALKTYGKPPVSRGGQSVTLVGTSLVIFGGEDSRRSPLNDLHILDLETLTWDEIDTLGVPPSPRSDHAAAVHVERYLLIFGGGSHAACFNDLHVLDLQTMEWTKPIQQGEIPNPRAGPASATIGESWFIAGGGDNKSGVSETVVLNMSTLAWSVVTTVQGGVPLASEGLSLVLSSCDGEDILVSFGGYNGKYNSEVHILKPSHKSTLQSKTMMGTPVPDSVSAVQNATNGTRDVESEFEAREIVMDTVDLAPKIKKIEETNEHLIAVTKAEKEELELSSSKEKVLLLQLKQELKEAKSYNTDLYTELQSVRSQLASENSRCFKLEVEVAELRQKLQTMDTLKKELELLQRQKATSEEVGLNAKHRQGSGGVWGWLAGTPGQTTDGV